MHVAAPAPCKYAIFNRFLALSACSPDFTEFASHGNKINNLSLFELFPELVGNEEIVYKMVNGHQNKFRLARLCRMTANPVMGRYYNLKLFALQPGIHDNGDGQHILVSIEDLTTIIREESSRKICK